MAKRRVRRADRNQTPCPHCGIERPRDEAHDYECPECGKVGHDCCVGGHNTLCYECENAET